MRARFLLASITGILGSFWGQSVWAQSVSILDAVQVVSPTLTIFLVREDTNPPQCLNFPIPDYCFQALRGQVAVYPVGVDGAGNSYNLVALDPVSANAAEHGYSFQQMDGSGNFQEIARIIGETSADPVTGQFKKYVLGLPRFDVTNGEVMFALLGSICTSTSGFLSCGDTHLGIVRVAGLPKLFDTLLTFVPSGQTLTSLTPGLPDGFRSADSLQAWAGNVRTLPDWSQATPLVCTAAVSPSPGEFVSFSDPLPDPPQGQARYYVIATQSGTQRRLGRQYVNGAFSARDPSGLPACQ